MKALASGPSLKVAVLGGDGRHPPASTDQAEIRMFSSQKSANRGDAQRLTQAIVRGLADVVFVLARWCGHSKFAGVRAACRRHGIPLVVVPGGAAALHAKIAHHLRNRLRPTRGEGSL
jgi:hypothetical protein